MRKILLASLVLSCACLTAQNRFPAINLANSDPSGTGCTLPNGISQYSTNLYICSGGTWHAIAGSGRQRHGLRADARIPAIGDRNDNYRQILAS
jgi:hypothetical protein